MAIVGAGSMAREHAKAFAAVPNVVLAGIHSRTRAKAEALAKEVGIATVSDSIDELFEKTRADLVVVTVFEISMREVATACFDFPWTVFLEKPAGYDVDDAQAIRSAATAKESRVFVALNRRFLTSTRAALADLATRAEKRFIQVQDQQSLDVAKSIGHPDVVVQNWMFANSLHLVDYLRAFGRGPVTKVSTIAPWNPREPGIVLARVDFESGDLGLYEGIWNGPGPWAVQITTPTRRWEMRPLEEATFQDGGERKRHPVELHAWDRAFKPGFRLQAEHAVAAALGKPSDCPSLDESLESMSLVAKIFG